MNPRSARPRPKASLRPNCLATSTFTIMAAMICTTGTKTSTHQSTAEAGRRRSTRHVDVVDGESAAHAGLAGFGEHTQSQPNSMPGSSAAAHTHVQLQIVHAALPFYSVGRQS